MANNSPHPLGKLTTELKRLLGDDSWVDSRTENHWKNGRNPRDGTVGVMADKLHEHLHAPNCKCTPEAGYRVIVGFHKSVLPSDWQGKREDDEKATFLKWEDKKDGKALFRLYLTQLAERLAPRSSQDNFQQLGPQTEPQDRHKAMPFLSAAAAQADGKPHTDDASARFLEGERFFDFFWRPFYYPGPSQRPACLWVWSGEHYFDFDAAEQLMRRFGFDMCQRVEFLKFDVNGHQLSRARYHWDTHRVICALGRRSLYKECDLIYDRRTGQLRPLRARFELPEVTDKTRRYMKKQMTSDSIEHFHHVRELDSGGAVINRYSVQPESENRPRVDFALIQRFTSESPHYTVYKFAGATSLGTRASVSVGVQHKFPGIRIPMPARENATIEMLFRVTADVQRIADSEHGKNFPWEPSLTDLVRIYIDGDLVGEEKHGQLVFVGA